MLVARKALGRVAKCIFDQIEAKLAEIQPKNHQNVQKMHFFLQKAPGQWVNQALNNPALDNTEIML